MQHLARRTRAGRFPGGMEILAQNLEAAHEPDDQERLQPRVRVAVTLLSVARGRVLVALKPAAGGPWCLPRRALHFQDTLEETARHELENVRSDHLEQLFTRAIPGGADERVLEVTYLALGGGRALPPQWEWWPLHELPPVVEGDLEVIQAARERLRRQLGHTRIARSLLPEEFTLSELQAVYEGVEERRLDKRNFRKWVLSNALVVATQRERRDGAHRPARLYRFAPQDPPAPP